MFMKWVYDQNQLVYQLLYRAKRFYRQNFESSIDKHRRERKEAEYLLISPTNCGRTWLRIMLGKVLQKVYNLSSEVDLHNLYALSEINPNIPLIKPIHERYGQFGMYEKQKVILLVRDPRDAMISKYFRSKRRNQLENPNDFSQDLCDYFRNSEDLEGYYIQLYNDWAIHKNSAQAFLLIKYEELRKNTATVLSSIINFLEITASESIINEAVEFASLENMKKMEKKGSSVVRSGPMVKRQTGGEESAKVRKGKVGGYKEYLTPEVIKYVNEMIDATLDASYGYNTFTESR